MKKLNFHLMKFDLLTLSPLRGTTMAEIKDERNGSGEV
jgi:hypothetical protein